MPKQRAQKNDRAALRSYKTTFETRRDETTGDYIITGTAAVYDVETVIVTSRGDTFIEVIQRGAFNDKTDLTDVRLFKNHQLGAFARSRNNNENSTMRLWHDDVGLHFEARLDADRSPDAATLFSQVDRGDMDTCSFGFFVEQGGEIIERKDGMKKRTVTQVAAVVEVSVVDFAAYPTTSAQTKLQSRAQECDLDIYAELESSDAELESEDENGEQAAELERLRNQNIINLWR